TLRSSISPGECVCRCTCNRNFGWRRVAGAHRLLVVKTSHWPLFGLRVSTPRIDLRYPDDEDCVAVAELAARGVHDPSAMPFSVPWTDVEPPLQQRFTLQHLWLMRAQWTAEQWHPPMAVLYDGKIVGVQAILAEHFSTLRAVATGSWLGTVYQG